MPSSGGTNAIEVSEEKLGKPQSFVSKMERGERRLDGVEFEEVVIALGRDPIEMLEAFTRGLTLKIVQEVALMNCGPYVQSQEWKTASRKLHDAVRKVVRPSGTKKFVINGESGK